MNDPILARARLLVNAAAAIPTFHSGSVNVSPDSPIDASVSSSGSPQRSPTCAQRQKAAGSSKAAWRQFKCTVITGSSLVSVTIPGGGDIRNHVKRGMAVQIDGVDYQLSTKKAAEWSATRVELTQDYAGETNFDAALGVSEAAQRSPSKKKVNLAEPVASQDIRGAVLGLDSLSGAFRRDKDEEDSSRGPRAAGSVRHTNAGRAMNMHAQKVATHSKPRSGIPTAASAGRGGSGGGTLESYIADDEAPRPPPRSSSYSADYEYQQQQQQQQEEEEEHPRASAMAGIGGGGSGIGFGMGGVGSGGGGSYLSQARHTSLETQRLKARERVLKKMRDDAAAGESKRQREDAEKQARKQAMQIKASQLREKTLLRVSKLKTDAADAEEARRAAQMAELDQRQRSQAMVQADDYQNKMIAMKKETARRLRARRQAEEDRLSEERRHMNRKLNAISDSRRRVDRDLPESYVPPAHKHAVARQTRTASPATSRVRGGSGGGSGQQRSQQHVQSRDDAAVSPAGLVGGYSFARSPSPVIGTDSSGLAVRQMGFSPPVHRQQQQQGAVPPVWHANHSPTAPEPPKRAPRHVSGIPPPVAYHRGSPGGGAAANDDDAELSDDSLGGPPQTHEHDLFSASPTRLQVRAGRDAGGAVGGASLDEDMSVLTFDSPQRAEGARQASNRAGAGAGARGVYGARHIPANAAGIPVTNTRKKKVWRALKPLAIREYSAVPVVQDGSVSER